MPVSTRPFRRLRLGDNRMLGIVFSTQGNDDWRRCGEGPANVRMLDLAPQPLVSYCHTQAESARFDR